MDIDVDPKSAEEVLDLLLNVVETDGMGFGSVGMAWIWENPSLFRDTVDDVDAFMESVFVRYDSANKESPARSLGKNFFRLFICNGELTGLLSTEGRDRLVEFFYPQFGSQNGGWAQNVSDAGVGALTIANAILRRLRTNVIDWIVDEEFLQEAEKDDRDRCTVDECVPKGHHEHQKIREIREDIRSRGFARLTDDQKREAFLLCAEKDPVQMIDMRQAMSRCMTDEEVNAVIREGMDMLTSLSGIPEDELGRMSTEERRRFTQRLVPVEAHSPGLATSTATFLFRLIVDLPAEEREAFWKNQIDRILGKAYSTSVYSAWRELRLDEPKVEAALRRWLDEDGFLVGTIGRFPGPKGGSQFAVRVGQFLYVQGRNNHRYFARDGDVVMFHREGRRLTDGVIAVNFLSVLKRDRR